MTGPDHAAIVKDISSGAFPLPPAARITDMHTCPMATPGTPPVPHVGGPVISGAPTVIVAGMPQARISDQCTCVGPPDVIVKGSATVLVAGMPAARLGDMTAHGGVITTGAPNVLIGEAGAGGAVSLSQAMPGAPAAAGVAGDGPPPVDRPYEVHKARLGGDDNVDVMFAEAGGTASAEDGRATAQGEAALGAVRMDHSGHIMGPVGGSHKLQTYTADAKAYGSIGTTGGGVEAAAFARMVEEEGSLFLGPDENNPYAETGGGYALMKAEAKGDALLGSDGRRAGVALGGKAGASAVEGDLKGEINIPIPFTDWTISGRGKVSGDAGSVGIGGGAHAYKDLQTGRYHGGVFGKAAAFLGIGGDLDLSIGPPYSGRDRRH
jgi:uncharacterized Zn-binding protein involved in type VI secretion